jgi:outer membrane protein assembly factor BamA
VQNSFKQPVLLAMWMAVGLLNNASAAGQPQSAVPAPKIGAIRVSGQKKFSSEEVIAATGLKAGQNFDPKDLDAVAERLGKSGVFPTISYSYIPEGGLISIEFKVEEATKFRACVFDNFVWVSEDEIQARLKKDVRLYTGMAPETGNMLDEIPGVLENLSREKAVTVHVARRIQAAQVGDPNWSHLFAAEGPRVRIQSFRFTGAAAVKPSDLEHEAEKFIGRDYSVFQCALFGSATIIPLYRERGYLRAMSGPPKTSILSRAADSSQFAVEVEYAVSEGAAYRWTPPQWNGNQLRAARVLESATGMKANEIANAKKIEQGWDAVRLVYFKDGYIEAKLLPEPVFDEGSSHVQYHVTVTEGPQYRMGSFAVSGASTTVEERLKRGWRLKAGDVYNELYAAEFKNKDMITALQGVPTRISKFKMATDVNREKHLVNITLRME